MESHPLQDGAQHSDTAELQHARLSQSVACLLAETANLGSNLAHAAPASGTVSGLEQIDNELGTFFSHTYELGQRLKRQTFTVAVLALAKSGKSTFLNAITGHPILPVNNIPETARICRITHTPLAAGEQVVLYDRSRGSPAETVIGESAIRQHLTLLNREVRMRQHQLHDEVMLDVQLPIASLSGRDSASEEVAFQLLDTPGPNESGEEALRFQVERLLDSVDAVIYLLDYTKLRTAEEASIFERIKSINPGLVKRLSRRLFFVVNKMDNSRSSEGLDEDATREYVAALVTDQLSGEGFQLRPDQVLLVSAQEALLSRLVLRREPAAAPEVVRRFKERAFGSSRAVQRKTFSAAQLEAAAQEMLEACGIQEVEASVFGFLYSHAGVLKLMAIVDDVGRNLNQMANSVAVSEGALMKDMAVLQDEAMALQKTLEDTLARFDEVQAQTATLEEEVVDEVRTRLGFLRERLVDHVVAVLDGAAADNERGALTGHWRAVFDKARAFLTRRAAGADRTELQQTLSELHTDIFKQIDQEVGGFWHQLETATNERQRALLRRLNMHLDGLSRAIEAVVSERLSVRLEPVDLRLKPPSAQEFHDSLQQLFAAGITQKTVVKERSREVEFTQWEKRYRNGICRTGEFYVGRPSKRTVQEQYTVTEYEIQPEKIKEYFCNLISAQIEASVRSVRAFVKQYLAATIDEARTSITAYAERFTSCMLSALATSKQGEEARLAALEHVRGHKEGLAKLLAESATLQAEAEAMFPEAVASMSRAPSLEFDDGDFLPAQEEPMFEPQVTQEAPLPDAPPFAAATSPAIEAEPSSPRPPAGPRAASAAGRSSPGGTAAVVHGDCAVCLLCGGADHWTDGCSSPTAVGAAAASTAPTDVAASKAAADEAIMVADPAAATAAAMEEDGSVVSGAADASTTGAAAASPRSSRSDGGEEEEDQFGDAASSLGGSFYQAGVPDAVPGAANSVGGSFCHAGMESAEGDAAGTAAGQPTGGAAAPLQADGKEFVANIRGQAVTSALPEPEPPALAGSDAFSGAALGASQASAAASSVSNIQLVAEPVPAHTSADQSQGQAATVGVDDNTDAPDDLATIPLGGHTPASPSAASVDSEPSSDADWTVVEDEHEDRIASARRQLSDPTAL